MQYSSGGTCAWAVCRLHQNELNWSIITMMYSMVNQSSRKYIVLGIPRSFRIQPTLSLQLTLPERCLLLQISSISILSHRVLVGFRNFGGYSRLALYLYTSSSRWEDATKCVASLRTFSSGLPYWSTRLRLGLQVKCLQDWRSLGRRIRVKRGRSASWSSAPALTMAIGSDIMRSSPTETSLQRRVTFACAT